MFSIMTADNSQLVTLNDNTGRAPCEETITAKGPQATYWAVAVYARKHGLRLSDVGYSVRPLRSEEC